ncbi:alpha-L-fucosidase [Lacibacter sp. H375]|uniref:alpha-L-fucosidase n=1 Tax=Lacibacter sp. H375 TaxID=3133424 RepID=UPI0030C17F3A
MTKFIFSSAISFVLTIVCFGQNHNPVPTTQQLKWHNSEYYLFTHFGPNTFTDKEWGHGDEPEDIFNPTELDCRQWCRIAKQAGATGIIITAKHHDGFCLWPSKFSKHTVRESKWKNGKGDVLKELAAACKEYGLNFGVYISPWDRNHPDYGTEKYNDIFVSMMKELFTNYGPITELWWDGANGEGPNGKKQVYDWKRFKETVRKLSPATVVFSDVGPDIRWVGNEKGIAGTTNWNTLNIEGFTPGLGAPSTDTLNVGNKYGKHWIPAECDVSIRPGWFYHAEEDNKVKTPQQLFDLYLKSVGRGATLLLNVPPDRRGKFHANDSAALVGFKKLRSASFKQKELFFSPTENTKLLTDGKITTSIQLKQPVTLQLKKKTKINCIVLKEDIRFGQGICKFKLTVVSSNGRTVYETVGTTIGRKRILTFTSVEATSIILSIEETKAVFRVSELEAYLIDETLIEKIN